LATEMGGGPGYTPVLGSWVPKAPPSGGLHERRLREKGWGGEVCIVSNSKFREKGGEMGGGKKS